MLPETQRSLHLGVNFLIAPIVLTIDTPHDLDLRRFLSDNQIEFARTERVNQGLRLFNQRPEPLEVLVKQAGPQVGQLLILAPQPTQPVESFIQQSEAVCRGFQNVWQHPQAQIINRDACIRYLYQSRGEHAFRFLWEERLRQNPNDIRLLGRPVLGGGLRFVMPPDPNNRTQVEIKIESFLQNSQMLFVELQFAWPGSVTLEEGFQPRDMLTAVQNYCQTNLIPFISGNQGEQRGRQNA